MDADDVLRKLCKKISEVGVASRDDLTDDEWDAFNPNAKPPKKGKKTTKKDPDAPKRAKSAYQFFCEEKRAEIKAAEPDIVFTEMNKRLGAAWKALSDKDKEPYEKKNKDAKQELAN